MAKKTSRSMYATDEKRSSPVPEQRTFDGSGNNIANPTWGQAGISLIRDTPNGSLTIAYADGISKLRKGPNPRAISNEVCKEDDRRPDPHPRLSSFMWAWGQFVDHEIDLSPEQTGDGDPHETESFRTPDDDPVDRAAEIHFARSRFSAGTGVKGKPREQFNVLSAYVDGANVYGASPQRALALRALDGTGKLRVSPGKHGDLLPFNTMGLSNPQGPLRRDDAPHKFFIAGDLRVNEHGVLICMHTLFVREHNRICDELAARPDSRLLGEIRALGRDEAVYRRARRHVIAIEQVITYEEFLPALLGPRFIPPYKPGKSYDPKVNASIANVFSTAAYRLGHDMLNSQLPLASPYDGEPLRSIRLDQAYWKPELIQRRGIDTFLAGLAQTNMEAINGQTVEDVRSNLFNVHPKLPNMLLDLAALNIQRGRDHGLPDYNQCRADYGLRKVRKFEDITSNSDRIARLKRAYKNVNDIDPWVGGLCEDPHNRAIVGELFHAILVDQFTRLRDGDRFWYECDPGLSKAEIRKLKRIRLSDVIKRNTLITGIQKDVFRTDS